MIKDIFCQKNKKIVQLGAYKFVQISPACGPNTYQIMYEKTRLSMSALAVVTENTDQKINFWSKFAFKTLSCYLC